MSGSDLLQRWCEATCASLEPCTQDLCGSCTECTLRAFATYRRMRFVGKVLAGWALLGILPLYLVIIIGHENSIMPLLATLTLGLAFLASSIVAFMVHPMPTHWFPPKEEEEEEEQDNIHSTTTDDSLNDNGSLLTLSPPAE